MSYYQEHVFICNNIRKNGKKCCAQYGADEMKAYLKERLKSLKISGAGKYRVNLAGCMGRCSEGPVLVIYPQGIWYTYASIEDIDEIIEKHILAGEVVSRLRLPDELAKLSV